MQDQARETAGITTRLVLAFVRDRFGPDGVSELLELAGETRSVEVLEDERSWSSYRQKIALFEAAARLTGDPQVARAVGEAVLADQLGSIVRVVIGSIGSPERVLRSVARANVKFSTSSTMRAIDVSAGHGVVAYRLHDEHQPSRHDCLYTQGILTQVPVLFGLPPATVAHPRCQVAGDRECVYELNWSRWRWWMRGLRRRGTHATSLALRQRVVDLERTVADLVRTDDLDAVLTSIAGRAAAAVRAQRHLLAVRIEGRVFVHADGIDEEVARDLGAQLLETGTVHLDDEDQLVAPVASAQRAHGWLAAFVPRASGFLPAEQEHLEAYAGLAAAALDVTTALHTARRSGETNAMLLSLSRVLAGQRDEASIAHHVAQAVPLAVGAPRASVLLWDAELRQLRSVAAVGFGVGDDRASSLQLSPAATPMLQELLARPLSACLDAALEDPGLDDELTRVGHGAARIASIVVDGELIGILVASHDRDANGDGHLCTDALVSLADQAGIAITRLRLLSTAVHAATHDHLTGLADRALFHDRVEAAILDSRRSGRLAAVCFLDLDGFKAVNDTYGHAMGDKLLIEVARRIRGAIRATDGVARMAGDEFAVLLRDLPDPAAAGHVAEKIVSVLGRPYRLDGVEVFVGVSCGVALVSAHGATPDELIGVADRAMYRAKEQGGGWILTEPAHPGQAFAVR